MKRPATRAQRRKDYSITLWILLTLSTAGLMTSCKNNVSPFIFKEDENGLYLSEDGQPVFFYQKEPKSFTGQYICNNYLHPLYSLEGDTLTEEFPADHPFHRGIFWAWHQLYQDRMNLGDGWINQGISYQVTDIKTTAGIKNAVLETTVLWKSDSLENREAFIQEHTIITVHRKQDQFRTIDFIISLKPLLTGIQIGGSDDEKGYGGFSARIKMPGDLEFSSEKGKVEAQNLQVSAGSWMDFTGSFGSDGGKCGVTIVSDPGNTGYPENWILRNKGSMQNVVFPGRDKFSLDKTLVLNYRVIVHGPGFRFPDAVEN